MSVIIRLQNLPWSANAMDIRNFFRGLSIPEGGVHIVGGEQGDAFIAFSTDEDARQAMLNNGGRLKEVQVKLLLSSRSEMLKVIETARQAVTFMQMSSQPALPAQPVVTQPSPIPQSISGLLAQNLKQLQVPALPLNNVLAANVVKSNDNSQQQGQDQLKESSKNNKDSKFDRRRSRSISRDRHKKDRNSRDSKKDKRERTRSRDRSRDRDRRRRERSRSRDRRDRKRDRNIHSRDRDRSKERSDRYKKGETSKDPKVPFGAKPPNNRPNAEPKTRFGGWASSAEISGQTQALSPNVMNPYLNQNQNNRPAGWDAEMPQQMAAGNPVMGVMPNPNLNAMMNMNNPVPPNVMPPQDNDDDRDKEMGDRRNPNSFQGNDKYFNDSYGPRRNFSGGDGRFNRGHSRFSRPYHNRDRPFRTSNFKVMENSCLKVSNLSDRTLYKDIRRFFTGLFIPSSGLKLINDRYGKYTGTAFVRFSSPQDKYEGLKRSGRILNGHNTVIEHLDDAEYDNASDLYLPNRRESPEREEEMDTSNDLIIVENTDETFKVLYLEDLPPFVKEQDIMKMFSDYSLLSITLYTSKDMRKQYVAYVQFARADDAKAALNDKSKHMIGHIIIKVSPCSDATYEQAKIDNAETVEDDNEMGNDGPEDSDMRLNEAPSQDVNVPRDPRQRKYDSKPTDTLQLNNVNNVQHFQNPMISQPPGMQPDMFSWRPNAPVMPTPNPAGMMPVGDRMPYGGPAQNNTFNGPPQRHRFNPEPILDCIFIKGLPLSATDKDVLNLFGDVSVTPSRIHLMLTLQGEPSGDCFCEFSNAGEASMALNKNGAMVGINRVSVELVPKSVVNDALGVPSHGNNFDMGGGMGRGFRGGRGGPPRGRGRGRGRGDFLGGRGARGGFGGGPPIIHPQPTESFGSPGTVVAMENVPYRATIDEITDFFSDFNVTQQDVIRRFNEHGQPTGDARVNLRTTFDAQKAVNMLNMSMLRDRTVTLSILQSN